MNRQQLTDIVSCLENAVKSAEGKAALPDYFGQLCYRFIIYDDEALAGIIAEVECMGKPLFFNTLIQRVEDIHGSGGYVYMSHELTMALQNFLTKYNN